MIQGAVLPGGYTAVPADRPWAPPDQAVRFIAAHRPDAVLDIGANAGQFAAALRGVGYRGRLISFEPQPPAFASLKAKADADPTWECHQVALGEADGDLPMHMSAFSES